MLTVEKACNLLTILEDYVVSTSTLTIDCSNGYDRASSTHASRAVQLTERLLVYVSMKQHNNFFVFRNKQKRRIQCNIKLMKRKIKSAIDNEIMCIQSKHRCHANATLQSPAHLKTLNAMKEALKNTSRRQWVVCALQSLSPHL